MFKLYLVLFFSVFLLFSCSKNKIENSKLEPSDEEVAILAYKEALVAASGLSNLIEFYNFT